MYVCLCRDIRTRDIEEAVAKGAHTFGQVQAMTGVATGCGTCVSFARAEFASIYEAWGAAKDVSKETAWKCALPILGEGLSGQ